MSEDVLDQQGAASGELQGQESVAELSSLLRCLLRQQLDRDAKAEEDSRRQEDRWQRIQHQFSKLEQQVQQDRFESQQRRTESHSHATHDSNEVEPRQSSTGGQPSSPARFSGWERPKMQPYSEGEDIEHYLITFERIAHACQWPQEEWALHLAPLLTGKARSAYVAMDIDDTLDYGKVKSAVLQKFEICAETYRRRFRSSVPGEEETPKELQARLKDLYDKWMAPKTKTKEEIGDIIVLEQFLKVLNPELRTWIKERDPKSSKEAAELAEAFLAARRRDYHPVKPRPPTPPTGN
ncbi:uncharacterized protein LOC128766297 [Synchiropus splendidus]|uniref:uncharacterized protein LOC128766297 n=1 Tax=Synchiropus splendidus TaxID=270530 RepID=UPI00237E2CE5|nr:uncharacterized protein LOC128766297 [Synchiropus splendidus]